jgi:hypothetical protein
MFGMKEMIMRTTTRTHILTPALWRELRSRRTHQPLATDPLLFLSQGVFHDSSVQGFVALRTIRELNTTEARATVYIEGTETSLSRNISVTDARLYAAAQDIIHQNGAYYSVVFKLISYPNNEADSEIYLWPIPASALPETIESDLPLSLSKGSTFYASATEKDIVMDRTIRMLEDSETSINIRTVEGRSYTTTVPAAEASRYAMPGDYYVERGSDELSVVYGVTTQPELPSSPIIKYTPLPAMTGP